MQCSKETRSGSENDRDCLGCCFRCQSCRWPTGHNHIDPFCDKLSGQCRQPAVLTFAPAEIDRNVLTFDIPGIFQTGPEGAHQAHAQRIAGRCAIEPSDHRHDRLLRARHKRQCRRRAAEQRDELAAFHSIISSARSRSDGGTSTPIALAVLRLITNSNFVGCSTGMSAGFVPRSSMMSCRA